MKIALLLTGFSRTFKETYPLLKKNILDAYDVDIYLCSWDLTQLVSGQRYVPVDIKDVLSTYGTNVKRSKFLSHVDHLAVRYDPITFLDREDDVFKVNKRAIEHGSYWVERLRDQWYVVKEVYKMIDNPNDYDIIMRLRFDVALYNIELSSDEFVIPKDIGGWNYSDHFAYGKPEQMKKYCHLFDHIENMYVKHNIDISHAIEMIKFYMEDYDTPVKTTTDNSIGYTILK